MGRVFLCFWVGGLSEKYGQRELPGTKMVEGSRFWANGFDGGSNSHVVPSRLVDQRQRLVSGAHTKLFLTLFQGWGVVPRFFFLSCL